MGAPAFAGPGPLGVRAAKGPLDLLLIALTVRNEEASGSIPLSSTRLRPLRGLRLAEPVGQMSVLGTCWVPAFAGMAAFLGFASLAKKN